MPARSGRPAKPTALKRLHNAGRRPINEAEPAAPSIEKSEAQASNVVDLRSTVVAVAAPDHLVGLALEKWNELAPSLATARVLTAWDRDALARYCCAVATEIEAQKQLDELAKKNPLSALLAKTPNGLFVMNAVLIVRNAASRDASKFGALLGLDPSSRSAIKIEKPEESDDWGRYA